MKSALIISSFLLLFLSTSIDLLSSVVLSLSVFYILFFIDSLNKEIALRQFILLVYSLNFLLAPFIINTYKDEVNLSFDFSLGSESSYFYIAISSIIFLHIGLFTIKTKIFNPNYNLVKIDMFINERILRYFVYIGIFSDLITFNSSNWVSYVLHLIGLLRYIGVFGLFIINKKKSIPFILIIFAYSIYDTIRGGMFGNTIQWMAFFSLIIFVEAKLSSFINFFIILIGFVLIILVQQIKTDYRQKVWTESKESSISIFNESINESQNDFSYTKQGLITNLERLNQGWILNKVVNRMDARKNFQNFDLLILYLESAFLPRFLAPNKLNAGDKEIFSKYTGHTLHGNTSMGLGVVADGYISFGMYGSILFSFFLGLFMGVIFKVIEK